MIVAITKLEFYDALLQQAIDREDYELCCKLRDYIKDIEDPDEVYIIEED